MKILVVDDDDQGRELYARVLRAEGYAVSTAPSGECALQYLKEEWEVVLTDLSMPGLIQGLDLLREVKATGGADVVIMTASPELDTAIGAVRGGAYDYLVKPFSNDALLLAIKRCLQKRVLSIDLAREQALRSQLQEAYRKLEEMDRVKKAFGQFTTPEVAEFILSTPDALWKEGRRRIVTVLFADVRQFTSFTGKAQTEEVVKVLNHLLAVMIEAVQQEGGVLNKFLGDGILAFFGAPIFLENHAVRAARAAWRIQAVTQAWAQDRQHAGMPSLQVGIGVNTGEVIAGCLGTDERAEYSVIGQPVNIAARLVRAAAPGEILLGPDTVIKLNDRFQVTRKGDMEFPGFEGFLSISILTGQDGSAP